MAEQKRLIVCCVQNELQAAQITKICQDFDIHTLIKIKPYIDIAELKKALRAKVKERLYDPCPCGKEKKFKFCCYEDTINFKFLNEQTQSFDG